MTDESLARARVPRVCGRSDVPRFGAGPWRADDGPAPLLAETNPVNRPSRARKQATAPLPSGAGTPAAAGLDRPFEQRSADEDGAFPIVGVGASAGGLEAFQALFRAIPPDIGMAFVLIPHLAPTHASSLVDILSRTTAMPMEEVADERRVEPNRVYVIPPGREMVIADGTLHLRPRDPHAVHRSVDRFLRSLAEDQKHLAIGVILSGTRHGRHARHAEIKAAGGITFAQDDTAQHNGMPRSAIATGAVDFVLPPRRDRARARPHRSPPGAALWPGVADELRGRSSPCCERPAREPRASTFTQYKPNTLLSPHRAAHRAAQARRLRRVRALAPHERRRKPKRCTRTS